MRDWIDIVKVLTEGDVVSLSGHKMDKAVDQYARVIQGIYASEQAFFKDGKFLPFAESYIRSNFAADHALEILVDVNFRDLKLAPETKMLIKDLRGQGFKITRIPWARDHAPKENPRGDCQWGYARKVVDINTAKQLFASRENSPLGAYQPSANGMRTVHKNIWDDRGVGFNITVGGQDCRRGDKYGNSCREEYHIVDDDKDMSEAAQAFALIQRAKIKGV
jgi:hypothetical protein